MKTIKKNESIGEMIFYRTAMTVIEVVRYPDGNTYPICPRDVIFLLNMNIKRFVPVVDRN